MLIYIAVNKAYKQDNPPCVIFPMGMEAYQFLRRLEIRKSRRFGKASVREAFFEGALITVVRCGVGPLRASRALDFLEFPPSLILCAGAAGALIPNMNVGDIVLASQSIFKDEPQNSIPCDSYLLDTLKDVCVKLRITAHIGKFVTSANPVFPRSDRLSLNASTGAVAVDMETHAIALKAHEMGIPFCAVRVITDDINTPAPPAPDEVRLDWRKPRELHRKLSLNYQRRHFLKAFDNAVHTLHDVLIAALRVQSRAKSRR